MPVPTRRLGATGPTVPALGLGAMGMSGMYGPADEAESVGTIHAALDAGITLLDTGDFYGIGHNELLIARALRDRAPDAVTISVKFGAQRGPDGAWVGYDARPAAVKTALAYTLTRLGTDHVDVYRPARLDPAVPIEETAGAIAELLHAGPVRPRGPAAAGGAAGGGGGGGAAGRRRAPGLRPADRVVAALPRRRRRDPAGLPRARRRHHRVRGAVAGPAGRSLARGPRAPRHGLPRPRAALPGPEPRAQP